MSDFDWRPMTGDDWMDLEPYPGPPHWEPTIADTVAALGRAFGRPLRHYTKPFEAIQKAFANIETHQSFPIPPRELNKPLRNHGPVPKRVFSHRGRKAY